MNISKDVQTQWFNYAPHLPAPIPPPIDPDDGKGSRIRVMEKIRIKEMCRQDHLQGEWVDIPAEVVSKYEQIGRPTQLYRARGLERSLGTPARIYLKREDILPTMSFKLNSSIAQAYYAKQEGAEGIVTETGAGQWGMAVAYSSNLYGLKSRIYWVKVSKERMPARVAATNMLGGEVYSSPSLNTDSGRKILEKDPECNGSIGTAIGDAINFSQDNLTYRYISGSNLPHVLLHQTIIGLETKRQLEEIGERPDKLIACVGGGSNLGGFMLPFLPEKKAWGDSLRLIAAESLASPRLTQGEYKYDHSDPMGVTPLILSYSLGKDYMPPPVYVGGLRQHNGSAVIGLLRKHNLLEAYAYGQKDAFRAGQLLISTERIIPAPESCHALLSIINFAQEAKKNGKSEVIVGCLSGSGLLDLDAYKQVLGV